MKLYLLINDLTAQKFQQHGEY